MKTIKDLIYCHECERGGNGNDPHKCAAGWTVKHKSVKGCFLGKKIVKGDRGKK